MRRAFSGRWSPVRRASLGLVLCLLAFAVYLANGRSIGSGDTLPTRSLAFSLIREGNFDLDEFPALYGEGARQVYPLLDGIPYFLRQHGGHYLSAYSPGPAIAALPVFLGPVLAGVEPTVASLSALEKVSAALLTALSVGVLFLAVAEVASGRWAVLVALAYAFGTSSLSVSSQGLWQHGPSQLLLSIALYFLARAGRDERQLAWAGLALGLAATMRATNALVALPIGVLVLCGYPRVRLRFALCAFAPLAAQLAYYLVHFRALDAGFGHARVPAWAFFAQTPFLEGVLGVLVSPARGLFVYSPVLVLSLAGIAAVWRHGPHLFRALSVGALLVVLVSGKWFMWWGGHTFGPRVLADLAPVLCFLLYPLGSLVERRRALAVGFGALFALSVGIHALGFSLYDGRWDALAGIDRNPAPLWAWREGPIPFYVGEAVARLRPSMPDASAPTSLTSPQLLAAAYTSSRVPDRVFAGGAMPLVLTAHNTGQAFWLATAPADHGAVRLGWRWLRDGQPVAGGREYLTSPVAPGASVRLRPSIESPSAPGDYTLVLDLVSEGVTWFSAQRIVPVEARVTVLGPDLERLLTDPVAAESSATATIATDRAQYARDAVQALAIELRTPGPPRSVDTYVALRGGDGRLLAYDGHALGPAQWPWRAWGRNLPSPAKVTAGFSIPLRDLPAGGCSWHIVVAEPQTYRVLARGTAAFAISP